MSSTSTEEGSSWSDLPPCRGDAERATRFEKSSATSVSSRGGGRTSWLGFHPLYTPGCHLAGQPRVPAFEDFHPMRARHQPVNGAHFAVVEIFGAGTAKEGKAFRFVEVVEYPPLDAKTPAISAEFCATMIATRAPPDIPVVLHLLDVDGKPGFNGVCLGSRRQRSGTPYASRLLRSPTVALFGLFHPFPSLAVPIRLG
jgi:hypothetical protein